VNPRSLPNWYSDGPIVPYDSSCGVSGWHA
jgi:hypothetical protein